MLCVTAAAGEKPRSLQLLICEQLAVDLRRVWTAGTPRVWGWMRCTGEIWNLSGNEDSSDGARCWNIWYLAVIYRKVWLLSAVRWETHWLCHLAPPPRFCWCNAICLKKVRNKEYQTTSAGDVSCFVLSRFVALNNIPLQHFRFNNNFCTWWLNKCYSEVLKLYHNSLRELSVLVRQPCVSGRCSSVSRERSEWIYCVLQQITSELRLDRRLQLDRGINDRGAVQQEDKPPHGVQKLWEGAGGPAEAVESVMTG